MQNLSIAIKNFNERVKQMNQTNSRNLSLSADEARNLHTDIFAILANIAELTSNMQVKKQSNDELAISLDGGNF